MNLVEIIQPLIENEFATEEDFQGLSLQEIEQIENHFNISFPGAYRVFLLIMGRRAGPLFRGTDLLHPHRFNLQEAAKELLEEIESEFQLPDNAFVFSMHQGYIFEYFLLEREDDDPPVYSFLETESDVTVISSSFSEYLRQHVVTYLARHNAGRDEDGD